ncbi:lysosome-associated membrane glycoprotein 5-like [Planococcus citri]|uniref:lysosome-associated membrane glycoprotein 5-like n=1 Tax=Planococcus citri TaxID=170843 RepID=UPI0031F74612
MYINVAYFTYISCLICLFPIVCLSDGPASNSSAKNVTSDVTNAKILVTTPSVVPTTSRIPNQTTKNDAKSTREDVEDTKKVESIKKMNLIKGSKVKTTPASNSNIATYRLNSEEDGTTCILMTVDALISFLYTTKLKEQEESDAFVPDKVEVAGDCSNADDAVLVIKWKTFELTFRFEKTPGGERWFVNRVQLTFNTKESVFKHINHPNAVINAQTPEGDLLLVTPVGRSFKCHREIEINLFDPAFQDLKVKLLLRELTIEPFIFKNNDFGPEYLCAEGGAGSFRSETAPFVFGSLLTVSALFTVAGYSIYRYLKVNKVQYDTMQ